MAETSPAPASEKKPRPYWRELLGFLLWGLWYLITMTENFSATHDSIAYLNQLELDPGITWYSHHLLWHALMSQWVSLWPVGLAIHTRIEILHAISGMILLMLFYTILRKRMGLNRPIAYAASAIPFWSYGIWCYSTSVEVYIIPLCFLLATVLVMSRLKGGWKTVVLASSFLSLAILFHQSHILFVPVLMLAWYLFQDRNQIPWKQAMALSLGVMALLVGIPYLTVMIGVLDLQNPSEMLSWLVGYGRDASYWAEPGLGMLGQAGVGFGRSFIGGQFAFALPGISRVTAESGFALADEAFLVRSMSETWGWVLIFLSGMFFIWLLSNVIEIGKRWRQAPPEHKQLASLFLLGIGIYGLFFLFWVPVNPEFWLPQMLFLCLILARFRLFPNRLWLLLPAFALGFINYLGSMSHLQWRGNDLYEVEARAIAVYAGETDRILTTQTWIRAEYIRRYAGSELTSLPAWYGEGKSTSDLLELIESDLASFRQVLLTQDAVRYRPPGQGDRPWWEPIKDRMQSIQTSVGTLYLITQ